MQHSFLVPIDEDEEEEDEDEDEEEKEAGVPITVCFGTMMTYLMIGALIFNYMEGWGLLTAAYFSFVTLATIGFGTLLSPSERATLKQLFTVH